VRGAAGFGLACHLGVLTDLPTVGVGKTLYALDGLDPHAVRAECDARLHHKGESLPLLGDAGTVWGLVRACRRRAQVRSAERADAYVRGGRGAGTAHA
jgi:deoxyinosine 3'endonuclease (endonuclease V)